MTGRSVRGALAVLLLLVGGAGPVAAHSYRLGDIAIGHIWAPPPADGAAGVPVYGALLNGGAAPVRLVGASTPVAEKVRFRIRKDGAESWPAAIVLRPGKPVGMAAWREHIWLSGLRRPLREGDTFNLALDFGESGRITVEVLVEKTPGH